MLRRLKVNKMNCASLAISALVAGGTIAMAIIAGFQLSKLNKSINDSNLMSYFEIEFELNRRKEEMLERRSKSDELSLGITERS